MKISFLKQSSKPKHKMDGRINPHNFWIYFTAIFLVMIIITIIYFTYFFVASSIKLDSSVTPKLDTNAAQIVKIDQSIKKIEDTVSSRESIVPVPQN